LKKTKMDCESRPVTADLALTAIHTCSYKLLINDVKIVHSFQSILW